MLDDKDREKTILFADNKESKENISEILNKRFNDRSKRLISGTTDL